MKRHLITVAIIFAAFVALAYFGADPIRVAASLKGEKLMTQKTA